MTISTMRTKYVVLGLAMCLLLSSFHEVSCQVLGNSDSLVDDNKEPPSNLRISKEEESQSSKSESESKTSFEKSSSMQTEEETSSSGESTDTSKFDSNAERRKQELEDIERRLEETELEGDDAKTVDENQIYYDKAAEKGSNSGDLSRRIISDNSFGELGDGFKFDSNGQRVIEESDQGAGSSSTKYAEELEILKERSKTETREAKFGATSSRGQYDRSSKKSNSASGAIGSFGFSQSAGSWTCVNQNNNGAKEEEDASIVIPKYDIDSIIKEESISQGSESKASSLVASLTKIVEEHKNKKWTSRVEIGKRTRRSSETVRLETIEKLKISLREYRSLTVRELVDHPKFEEILVKGAKYEEVSMAKVSYISRLSMYRNVIIEGRKASERVQLAEKRISLHKDIVKEKQNNVDTEFSLVKALAQRGDMLKVKIFAIKKMVLKLEAEKEEVDVKFQRTVANLYSVIEESSKAEESYHLVIRKWKEEKASAEYSQEAIQSAETVWYQFLSTLQITSSSTN